MKLFIFGSTGDLIKRKVMKELQNSNLNFEIIALGRKKMTNKEYYNFICGFGCNENFKKRIKYTKAIKENDFCYSCENYLDKDKINYFYISMPPEFYLKILKKLSGFKKKGYKIKILIEKPFGESYLSAIKIKKFIESNNLIEDVFLADHYLFKIGLEKANLKNYKKIKIVSNEVLGLEGRSYYDSIGALKDMVQSHFFNILFKYLKLSEFEKFNITKFKIKQYKDYQKELGKKSNTETYLKLEFETKNYKIEFETGKKMNKKETYLELNRKRIDLLSGGEYKKMISEFINKNKKGFPSINQSIFSWKIIEMIEKNKPEIEFY